MERIFSCLFLWLVKKNFSNEKLNIKGFISISITFFNKGVFEKGFQGSNTLTLGQLLFSLIFLELLKKGKYLEFEDFNFKTAKSVYI